MYFSLDRQYGLLQFNTVDAFMLGEIEVDSLNDVFRVCAIPFPQLHDLKLLSLDIHS